MTLFFKIILIYSFLVTTSTCFAQDKILPIFPDNIFYNFQSGQSRVGGAINKYEAGWKKLFAEKGLQYPATNIFFRSFKYDQKFEVYARNTSTDTFTLLKTFDVCVKSGTVGPKRAENDHQVPEGFYFIDEFKHNSNYWLSMLVSYPNYSDLLKGNKETPGGEIYIHGSCVTVGCLPMTDDLIEEIYCLAVVARTNGQYNIPVHIFPTHFNRKGLNYLGQFYSKDDNQKFWTNLKKGYDYFEATKKILPVMYDTNGNYLF
jgi:murein L,D-transpeptidase YafK